MRSPTNWDETASQSAHPHPHHHKSASLPISSLEARRLLPAQDSSGGSSPLEFRAPGHYTFWKEVWRV